MRSDDIRAAADERAEDIRMLCDILHATVERDEDVVVIPASTIEAFQSMYVRLSGNPGWCLTEKQRGWVRGVYEKVFDTPVYENLVSAGKVPLGKPVEVPEVLRVLPKRPPVRRVDNDDESR